MGVRRLTVLLVAGLFAAPVFSAEDDIPNIEVVGEPAISTGGSDTGDGNSARGAATDAPGVELDIATGGVADGDAPGQPRQFVRGKRQTLVEETYPITYIERMELNDDLEEVPVTSNKRYGRWLDLTVNRIDDDAVAATLYYVTKRPVNLSASDRQGPVAQLPESDMSMVSREVTVPRGESRQVRVGRGSGAMQVRLGAPALAGTDSGGDGSTEGSEAKKDATTEEPMGNNTE